MTKTRFDTRMTAHVWAQGKQDYGQNSNGQFYFEKEILYSYGAHFVVGVKLPDVTFINGDKRSITTSKHSSYARSASYGVVYTIPDLTDIATQLVEISSNPKLPRDDWNRVRIQHYVKKHGHEFATDVLQTLMGFAGLPNTDKQTAAYHAKLNREFQKVIAAREKATAKRDYDKAIFYVKTEFESDLESAKSYQADDWSRIPEHETVNNYIKAMRAHLKNLGEKQIRLANKLRAGIKELTAIHKAVKSKWLKSVELFDFSEKKRAFKQQYQIDVWSINLWIASATSLSQHVRIVARPALLAKINAAIEKAMFDRDAAQKELDAARFEANRVARERWLAGESSYGNFTDVRGGALLRVKGDQLETSQGAKVPLADAIKVFKMVKLVKERGHSWKRNGATLAVGHFQVDIIRANGDFIAGCHTINWSEIERIARELKMIDIVPEDTTSQPQS